MGGKGIFRIRQGDTNADTIIEALTRKGQRTVMLQQVISDFRAGDKRILLIDGQPVPYALRRIPPQNKFRANMVAGGTTEGAELSEHDLHICETLAPMLKKLGLFFVGIDVIGRFLTEINVTSPTGVRELNSLFSLDIGGDVIRALEYKLELAHR